MKVVNAALSPFMHRFLKKREHCSRFTPETKYAFIAGCVPEDGCTPIKSLAEAKRQCTATPLCGGDHYDIVDAF